MGNEINKIYNKAMNYHQIGEHKKALELCEIGISKDLRNTSLLNLKGLLFYLEGDLNGARVLWNINRDYNNDEVSKVYLRDSIDDENKLTIFEAAKKDINSLDIDEAINKLKICGHSDFNAIKVNCALANCLIKKGEYALAEECIKKALIINKRDIEAITIDRDLRKIIKSPTEDYKQKLIFIMAIVVTLSTMSLWIFSSVFNERLNLSKLDIRFEEQEENNTADVDSGSILENKYEETKEVALTDEEVKSIYLKGTDLFDNNDYNMAIETLSAAVNNTNSNYLNEHILFLLASSYDNNKIITNGIKYYESYVDKYEKGSYIEEVYYRLAILYKDENNLEKSKEYANKLHESYPKSIYVNTIIQEIISS